MVSQEALSIYAKACELFILDLTMRGCAHAISNRRRTLQRSDLAAAALDSDPFDFLIDIIPKHESPE
jgi:nuclear transcription factor Y gamma